MLYLKGKFAFKEPWSDISEYPDSHKSSLEKELAAEIGSEHVLTNRTVSVIAKRKDCDDILVLSNECYFIVHLTWKSKTEESPWPMTEKFEKLHQIEARLAEDAEFY